MQALWMVLGAFSFATMGVGLEGGLGQLQHLRAGAVPGRGGGGGAGDGLGVTSRLVLFHRPPAPSISFQ